MSYAMFFDVVNRIKVPGDLTDLVKPTTKLHVASYKVLTKLRNISQILNIIINLVLSNPQHS